MSRRVHLHPYLTTDELRRRFRRERDPVARSRWHILWLVARGYTAAEVADTAGYSAYWVGQIAKRYNEQGPESVSDHRHQCPGAQPLLSPALLEELRADLANPPSEGKTWTGRTVAQWMSRKLGREVSYYRGWSYLRRLREEQRRELRKTSPAPPPNQTALL